MKKFFRVLLIVVTAAILLIVLYALVSFPPIMRGMAAKTMCSCVFVGGRSPESVKRKELQVFPGLADVPLEIKYGDSTVTATLLFQRSRAIYRSGLGCTLLAEAEEEEVRRHQYRTFKRMLPAQDSIPWPAGDLHAVTTAHNIDRRAIEKVVDDAFREKDPSKPANTHAVVAVYKGKIIAERYAPGFNSNSMLAGWSMTKSITNALIGILVRDGRLHINAPAPVREWSDDERSAITLNHLLQASSGLAWSESYFLPGADFHNMFILSDDKAGYAASRPLEQTPGKVFEYSSGTTNILARIIRETVGEEHYHRFPYEALFARIGMHHSLMEVDASGTFVASSYGFASARDWARLGLLYLNDGVWNGERILPEGWVRYSTSPAPGAPRREYGAQIWLNLGAPDNPDDVKHPGIPREAFLFEGFEDNFVVIVPSKELVVVRLGVTHNDQFDLAALVSGISDLIPTEDNIVTRH